MENGDDDVSQLLISWGLSDLKAKFKANCIVFQALEFLTEEDIIELIPKIGQRAIFRGRLLQWRQQNGIDVALPSTVCKLEAERDTKTDQQTEEPNKSPPKIEHKIYGTLTKCAQKPKKVDKNASKATMQSKVQQFYISPVVEGSKLPSPTIPLNTNPHAVPFATSIIRVETNCCDKSNDKDSPSNANAKVNRTTILQKLSNSQNTHSTNGDSQNLTENTEEDLRQDRYSEEAQTDASHLYPIIKLETEMTDTNWSTYNELQSDDVQIITDSTDYKSDYIESIDSESALEVDSENDNSPSLLRRMHKGSRKKRLRNKPSEKIDIRSILMASDIGRYVLRYYEVNECLDSGTRRNLIDVIAKNCWMNERNITPFDCGKIAEEIIKILPNERLDFYYTEQPGKSPKSPLYNKFRNMSQKFFIDNGLPIPVRRKKKARLSLPKEKDTIEIEDDDIIIS